MNHTRELDLTDVFVPARSQALAIQFLVGFTPGPLLVGRNARANMSAIGGRRCAIGKSLKCFFRRKSPATHKHGFQSDPANAPYSPAVESGDMGTSGELLGRIQ
jgi:hypothetical protein